MVPSQKESQTEKLTDEQVIENADIADGNADSVKDGDKRPAGWKPRIIPTDEVIVDFEDDEHPR